MPNDASLVDYYAKRAGEYERIYDKPERQEDLAKLKEEGNTFQYRKLDNGDRYEVLKNFPGEDEVRTAVGDAGTGFSWRALQYYWFMTYTLR